MALVKAKLRSFGNKLINVINTYGHNRAHYVLTLHGFTYNEETKQYERQGN